MILRQECSPVPADGRRRELYPRLEALVRALVEAPYRRLTPHFNVMAVLSNVTAALFYEMNHHASPAATLQELPVNWLGLYLLQSPQLLALGPFQGRPTHMAIEMGHGVCGTAAQMGEVLIVPDAHAFPGHVPGDAVSKSEIAVPIKSAAGHVVGVMNVVSTRRDFFDEVDAAGLKNIAAILVLHVEFPMARTLAKNPLLADAASLQAAAVPSPPPLPGNHGGSAEPRVGEAAGPRAQAASLPSPATRIAAAVITRAPPAPPVTKSTQVEVNTTAQKCSRWVSRRVGGWEFSVTEFSRILTQEEVRHYEEALGISAIPEIPFAFNTLRIAPAERTDAPFVSFSLLEVLRSAAAFYRSKAYSQSTLPQLQVPVAESWKHTQYTIVDAKVDWAWRNNYFGVDEWRCRLKPLEPSMPGVNWGLLKDRTLPILFFHQFDMMEDDLHDHGVVTSSVRIRVMSEAFFLLFRHFVRVDGYRVWMREVRLFQEFAVKRPDGQPHLVVREEVRILDLGDGEKYRHYSPDDYAREATVVEAHDFYANVEDPTYGDWWASIGVA
ncbi:GAF domain-containing protein [Trypanosoma conorhini]|uniref:GAF domain-containing protein n=1 Tax=Trypanosoma conorhini TaxID=83891 RepID=A0A422PIL5_9TRYP|nr:GAF domain-containing protein [Trypanosoma conorhini]RNF17558.1 GAF domain-containing protein [Trypanosoma conorhini]